MQRMIVNHAERDVFSWHHSLRKGKKGVELDTNLVLRPVGSALSGIYPVQHAHQSSAEAIIRRPGISGPFSKSLKVNPYYKDKANCMRRTIWPMNIVDIDNLVVHGISKLPLEAEAAELGLKFLNLGLVEKGPAEEQIIVKD